MVMLATTNDCEDALRSSRYIPVLPDVVHVSKLAVHHLSRVMFKERHPPDPVPGVHAGLRRNQARRLEDWREGAGGRLPALLRGVQCEQKRAVLTYCSKT